MTLAPDWIQNISESHVDPRDVISERLPSTGSSWLPVNDCKEYTLIFVVDRDQEKVRRLVLTKMSQDTKKRCSIDSPWIQEARNGETSVSPAHSERLETANPPDAADGTVLEANLKPQRPWRSVLNGSWR